MIYLIPGKFKQQLLCFLLASAALLGFFFQQPGSNAPRLNQGLRKISRPLHDMTPGLCLQYDKRQGLHLSSFQVYLCVKLTVRCCLQRLVSPTGSSEDRHDELRTAETETVFNIKTLCMHTSQKYFFQCITLATVLLCMREVTQV